MNKDTRPDGCRFRLGLGGRKPMQTNKAIKDTFVQTIRGIKYRITLDDKGEIEIAEVKSSSLADTYAQLHAGETKEQTVKQLFSKINEELDELKAVVLREVTTRNRLDDIADGVDDDTDTDIADKAIDTITAITTMLETLGINAGMRNEESPKCEVTDNGLKRTD